MKGEESEMGLPGTILEILRDLFEVVLVSYEVEHRILSGQPVTQEPSDSGLSFLEQVSSVNLLISVSLSG